MSKRPRQKPERCLADALKAFLGDRAAGADSGLSRLWADWDRVFSPEFAAMARPLGHKDRTLVLGVPDAITMQELTMFQDHILDKVNGYLGMVRFTELRLELQNGRIPLDGSLKPKSPSRRKKARPVPPDGLRGQADIAADTAVGKCYAAYLRLFGLGGGNRRK